MKNKRLQKSNSILRDLVPGLLDAAEKYAPKLFDKLPSRANILAKLPDNKQLVTMGAEKIVSRVGGNLEDAIDDYNYDKKKQKQYNPTVASKSAWAKFSGATGIRANAAKKFVELSGQKFDKPITEKQISKVFDKSAILGIMASSKTVSELKHKVEAGIALNNIVKKKTASQSKFDKI
jgi:hypothetical protein